MQDSIITHLTTLLPHIQTGAFVREAEEASRARERLRLIAATADGGTSNEQRPATSTAPRTPEGVKLGRNDLCFCGSGKKYKKCHGANQ
jgi:preprotein translocase subunit SecA